MRRRRHKQQLTAGKLSQGALWSRSLSCVGRAGADGQRAGPLTAQALRSALQA